MVVIIIYYIPLNIFNLLPMQNQVPTSVMTEKDRDSLLKLPENLSRGIKQQVQLLMEPFTSSDALNAKIKRIFSNPQQKA